MTIVAPTEHRSPGHDGPIRRTWAAPLWAHVLALAVVLVGVMGIVGTQASFSADEGAAIIQARSLERGDGWIVPNPVPEADPSVTEYPLELSARGPNGEAPFAKHPLYAIVLAGAERLGGTTAMVALSLLGTVLSAGLAAVLAARVGGTGMARPALWAVGIGTPLFFDGYLVIAHTLGAALAAAAVLVAASSIERRNAALAVPVAGLLALAVLFRTEAVILAAALSVALLAVAVRHRAHRRVAGLVALAVLGGAGIASVAEGVWTRAIVGGVAASTGGGVASSDLISDRVHAFAITWLSPTYDDGFVEAGLLVMAVAVALTIVAARRHPDDGGPVRLLVVVAIASAVTALVADPGNVVPGLLVSAPLVLAGLLAVRRVDISADSTAFLSWVTFAAFACGVLLTQYATGGSGEWGGRYFAIGLPVLVPVALVALRRTFARTGASTGAWAVAGLVACTAVMSVMAAGSLRETHELTRRLMLAAERAGLAAGQSAVGDERPVLLTTRTAVPRAAWATFDEQRWVLTRDEDVGPAVESLVAAGIERVAIVSRRPLEELTAQLRPGIIESVDPWAESQGWNVLVVDLT